MLRHTLKWNGICASRLMKCRYRGTAGDEASSSNQVNPWDDPWSAALPKERTETTAIEIPVDWKYVQRLMAQRIIPEVPQHSSYPTPSGWRPPKPKTNLTFYVERGRDHLLPIFLETRRDQLDPKTLEFEYVELVMVKKIHGDIFECEKRMREYLEDRLQHPIATHVDELKGLIRIKGADRAIVEECLYEFGF